MADWPSASWELLRQSGALGWSVPKEYGGTERSPVEILRGSEQIANACAAVAFALSQRESAIRRLLSGPQVLKSRYLPRVATGEIFVTVGFSQLSTSRQHTGPSLHAEGTSDGYILNGELPWVTGADQAEGIVAGATLADGRQLLALLPKSQAGVEISQPMALSALLGSRTSVIHCRDVRLEEADVISGPMERVLGPIGGGGLETSCVALGLTEAAIESLRVHAEKRPQFRPLFEKFEGRHREARRRLHKLAAAPSDPEAILSLRVACTRLVLNSTQANLLAAKGTGFVEPHEAQHWARQALFFLVWSSPPAVVEGMMRDFLDD